MNRGGAIRIHRRRDACFGLGGTHALDHDSTESNVLARRACACLEVLALGVVLVNPSILAT